MSRIRFIRHLKVDYVWPRWCNSEEFAAACAQYDLAEVEKAQPLDLDCTSVYISTQVRTFDTCRSLLGKQVSIIKTSLLNEVPIAPFLTTKRRLPVILWTALGRLQWYLNSTHQPESRRATRARVHRFLDHFTDTDKGSDCVIIGHGFYFTVLAKVMESRGAQGSKKRLIRNGELREFILKD